MSPRPVDRCFRVAMAVPLIFAAVAGLAVVTGLRTFVHAASASFSAVMPGVGIAIVALLLGTFLYEAGWCRCARRIGGACVMALGAASCASHPLPIAPLAPLETAIALLLCGVFVIHLQRTSRTQRLTALVLQAEAASVLFIAAITLALYVVPPESLPDRYRDARMGWPMAAALLGLGIAMLGLLSRSSVYRALYQGHEDKEIFVLTMGILFVVFLGIGTAGFATMQRQLERSLHAALRHAVQNRGDLLRQLIDANAKRARMIASRPAVKEALRNSGRQVPRERVLQEAKSYIANGFTGIVIRDESGTVIAAAGNIFPAEDEAVIGIGGAGFILWDGGFLMRVTTPVVVDGRRIGSVISEQRMQDFLMNRSVSLAQSEVWELCGTSSVGPVCFEESALGGPRRVAAHEHMTHSALGGSAGASSGRNSRGVPVISGIRGVESLELAVKLDVAATEFYAPLREQLGRWAAWMAGATLACALLVSARVRPVARRLMASEAIARRRARNLARSERALRQLYDSLGDGIIVFTADGTIELVNPAAGELFGYAPADLSGKAVSTLIPNHLRSVDGDAMQRQLEGGDLSTERPRGLVFPGLRSDGTTFMAEFSLSTMRRDDARLLVGVVRDVSERTALERRKTEFVSTVSHELRTPLTSINGSLGLLVGGVAGPLPPAAGNLVEIAADNCRRLIRLVNDILDIEKITTGHMTCDPVPSEVETLLQAAVCANSGFAAAHGVSLALAPVPSGWRINVDPGRFDQSLANLISNAVKYSPKNGEVTVSARVHDAMVLINVRDHGPGIPVEFRSRLFEKFTQADGSDSRKINGSGLGLCITRGLVSAMGGSIEYDTELGKGTTFRLTFPLWEPERPLALAA